MIWVIFGVGVPFVFTLGFLTGVRWSRMWR